MTTPEPSGFCWACGRVCPALYCNEKCRRAYAQSQETIEQRGTKRGKRAGYGVGGSTH